jgi:hypothetical protein
MDIDVYEWGGPPRGRQAMADATIKDRVRERYAEAARAVEAGGAAAAAPAAAPRWRPVPMPSVVGEKAVRPATIAVSRHQAAAR